MRELYFLNHDKPVINVCLSEWDRERACDLSWDSEIIKLPNHITK